MNEEASSTFCSPCGSATPFPFQDQYDIIDLSYSLNDQTIFWPGDEVLSLCMTCFHDDQFNYDYAAGYIKCPEHGGTHVDAPYHFNKNGITIEKIPLRQLICSCRVIDISEQCNNNRDYCLLPEDILNYERNCGLLQEKEVVLIRTGWWRRYLEGSKSYLNYDKSSDGEYDPEKHFLSFPGIGKEAATFLIERNITAVGIDTASIDCGNSKDFVAHTTLLGAGIYAIENINGEIDRIPANGSILLVMPLKITGGSGSPARILNFIPIGK